MVLFQTPSCVLASRTYLYLVAFKAAIANPWHLFPVGIFTANEDFGHSQGICFRGLAFKMFSELPLKKNKIVYVLGTKFEAHLVENQEVHGCCSDDDWGFSLFTPYSPCFLLGAMAKGV